MTCVGNSRPRGLNVKLTKEELLELYLPQERGPADRGECPTSEQIVLATTEDLPRPEVERVTAHLLTCRHCAEEYQLIRPLQALSERAAPALAGQPRRHEAHPVDIRDQERRVRKPQWWRRFGMDLYFAPSVYAMAALLLVVSIGLGSWALMLRQQNQREIARLEKEAAERERTMADTTESLEETRRQLDETRRQYEQDKSSQKDGNGETEIAELRRAVEELSRPQLNAPIVNLEPQASVRGAATNAPVVEVPSGANIFTVVLNLSGQQAFSSYALDISDQGGKVIWQGRGLRKSEYNTFTVALARRLLPAGQYHLKLYGSGGGERKLVEEFAVRIHYAQ